MKKITAVLLTAAMTLGIFSCCGKSESTTIFGKSTESETISSEATNNTYNSDNTNASGLACPSLNGKLHVDGTKLCDENGSVVQLRGVSTHGISWFPGYVNEQCFADLKSWGANVVRLAMYTYESGGYCTDGDKTKLKKLVEDGVNYAQDNDMYAIVDWHVLNEGNPNTYSSQAISFFTDISKEFADNNNVIYEICNEPCNGTSWSEIKTYADKVIPVIRANDKDAVIIVGTPNWSQDLDVAAESPITGYDNIMYALHFYAGTHKESLQSKLQTALNKSLPVFVSEYGICDASGNGSLDTDSANKWISILDANDISYVCWNLSNKNESSAIISSNCSKTSGFTSEDLSGEGTWLYNMLQSHLNSNTSGSSSETTSSSEASSSTETPSSSETTSDSASSSSSETTSDSASSSSSDSASGSSSDSASGSSSDSASGSSSDSSAHNSQENLTVDAVLINSWSSNGTNFYQYELKLNNTSSKISSWKVSLDFDNKITLVGSWNGKYTASANTLTVSNESYNGTIEANSTISGIGFIVSGGKLKN